MNLGFSVFNSVSGALRILPAAALAIGLLGGTPASAATGTVVTSPGDLALTLGTTSVSPVAVGQPLTVGLGITNTTAAPIGPFTYTIQASATTKLNANFPGLHTCARGGGNSISCTFLGALQPGLTDNAINVTVTATTAGPLDVVASVAPTLGSTAPSNSVDLAMTAIASTADLQVTQGVSNAQPAPGAPVTYTVAIKNAGPNTAAAATLSDTIGADGTPLSATASNGAPCGVAGQVVSCSLGDLVSGGSVSVSVAALAPTLVGSTISSTAVVSSSTYDPNLANNTASVSVKPR